MPCDYCYDGNRQHGRAGGCREKFPGKDEIWGGVGYVRVKWGKEEAEGVCTKA